MDSAVFDVDTSDRSLVDLTGRIFRRLADRFSLVPEEALFVDDAEANVLGARAAGFVAHRFVDAATLEAVLGELGLIDAEVDRGIA